MAFVHEATRVVSRAAWFVSEVASFADEVTVFAGEAAWFANEATRFAHEPGRAVGKFLPGGRRQAQGARRDPNSNLRCHLQGFAARPLVLRSEVPPLSRHVHLMRGTSAQRFWALTSQKKARIRQRIRQPPSSSPASTAVMAAGRLNLSRGSMNNSMNGVV